MSKHVAVMGGGVVGLATAWALICSGQQVTLIEEAASIGEETSYANGGQLSYRYVSPLADAGVPLKALAWMLRGASAPLLFRPRLDPAQWRWCLAFLLACRSRVNQRNGEHLLRLALFSQQVLSQWRDDYGLDGFAWRRSGKLVIYRDDKGLKKAADKLINAHSSEESRVLDATACLALEPALIAVAHQLAGGIYSETDEAADCYLFCQTLEQRLLASGRYTRLQRQVSGFVTRQGCVSALKLTGTDDFKADEYVLATGNASRGLAAQLGIRLPLYPLKGYSLTLPFTGSAGVPEVSVTDFDNKVVYARLGEQFRVAAMVDIGNRDTQVDPARIAALRRLCEATFPDAGDYQHAQAWAGLRPSTPEGPPILGATALRNFWLNTGHGSLGFTLACACGQILADLIAGRPTPIHLQGLTLQDLEKPWVAKKRLLWRRCGRPTTG